MMSFAASGGRVVPRALVFVAVAMAMALASLGSQPASATSGAGAGTSIDCEGINCVQGTGALVSVTNEDAGGVVEFQCVITAPGAAATAVTSCTAGGTSAPNAALPGPAVATVGLTTVDTSVDRLEICWEGSATFVLGGETVGTEDCSLVNVGVEIPPDIDRNLEVVVTVHDDGGGTYFVTCTAFAYPDPLVTSVHECHTGEAVSMPGPLASTRSMSILVDPQASSAGRFQEVCYRGGAVFSDGTTLEDEGCISGNTVDS